MKKITTHLWFDTQAVEACKFYIEVFGDAEIRSQSQIKGTPSGDCDILSLRILDHDFMFISAGPYFKFTTAISFFVTYSDETRIDGVCEKLLEGGEVMMPYQKYPWATKYGWIKDKFGLTWQLSLSENHQFAQKITPALMYVGDNAGKASEAIDFYATLDAKDGKVVAKVPYEEGDGDKVGYLKHARFSIFGSEYIAMDSSGPHAFTFNEAVSFIISCEDQEEIDKYWEMLSHDPKSEQCGWLKDKWGVSWQIVPKQMGEMMSKGTPEQIGRVTKAFLPMKKFIISELEKAFEG